MEKIKATVDANYQDRDINGDSLDINFDDETKSLWFNATLSNKREDDYITISCKLNELLEAIGKAVENGYDD